ncbi:response regulator [Chitinophaga oryziterrae]|nr:response regulator [Chitinophaga oryziterrae]
MTTKVLQENIHKIHVFTHKKWVVLDTLKNTVSDSKIATIKQEIADMDTLFWNGVHELTEREVRRRTSLQTFPELNLMQTLYSLFISTGTEKMDKVAANYIKAVNLLSLFSSLFSIGCAWLLYFMTKSLSLYFFGITSCLLFFSIPILNNYRFYRFTYPAFITLCSLLIAGYGLALHKIVPAIFLLCCILFSAVFIRHAKLVGSHIAWVIPTLAISGILLIARYKKLAPFADLSVAGNMSDVFIIAPVILLLIVFLMNYYRVIYQWLLRNIVRPLFGEAYGANSIMRTKNKDTASSSKRSLFVNAKILVIADNYPDQIPIDTYLQEIGIPTTFSTCSSQDGLNILDHFKPDLIIAGIQLPGPDGLDIINNIRQHPISSHLPLIAISESNFPEAGRKAIAAGADAYLFHPIQPTQLSETLNLLLEL